MKGFRAGDQVKAVIISIDREKRQVNFSIKASLFSDKVVNGDDDEEMAEDVDDAEAGSDDEDDEDEDADEDQLEGLDIEGEEEDEDDVEEEEEEEDEAAEDDSDDDEVKVSYTAYVPIKADSAFLDRPCLKTRCDNEESQVDQVNRAHRQSERGRRIRLDRPGCRFGCRFERVIRRRRRGC